VLGRLSSAHRLACSPRVGAFWPHSSVSGSSRRSISTFLLPC
jgi:hypothetical protein